MIKVAQNDDLQKALLTIPSFLNMLSIDNSGHALTLYCFYAMKAADRDESRPYCTDEWTAFQLKWDIKTVAKYRKMLARIGVITMFRKGRKYFIQVNYLPFKVNNTRRGLLSDEHIPGSKLFDYYPRWIDNIEGNPTSFVNVVCKEVDRQVPQEVILESMRNVYANICRYNIKKADSEKSFFFYLIASVKNKLNGHAKS